MTTAAIALAAAAAALLIVGFVWVGGARGRRASDARLAHAFERARRADGGLARDMGERAQRASRRSPPATRARRSRQLDRSRRRARATAEAAALMPGADASAVHATAHDGSRVVASVGSAGGNGRVAARSRPSRRRARRARSASRTATTPTRGRGVDPAGLGVPLRGESDEPLGFLSRLRTRARTRSGTSRVAASRGSRTGRRRRSRTRAATARRGSSRTPTR